MTADANFCPYVGLQPFTEEDRAYFFGREREIRLVGANLYAAKLTVLYGESGVGKSSVLMAGVVPELRQKPRTAVVIFRDWQRPEALSILKAAVAHAGDEAAGKPLGLDAGTPLDDLLAAAGKAIGGTTLVLMDQFEEYFLYYPPGGAGDEFDAELARAVNRRDVNAGFVLSIREDSLSKLDRFRARIPTVLANPLRIRHLRPRDARDATCKPLDVYNQRLDAAAKPVSIEPALVDALIEQTISGRVSLAQTGAATDTKAEAGERVEAPYLQLVLARLWNEEGGLGSRVLRLATLETLGGASRIVRTHLDQVMSRLSPHDQALCADFFDRLVTPSGTKIACRLDDLKQWAGVWRASDVEGVVKAASDVEGVVKALAAPEARILRAIDPLPGQPPQYEIFHDVLAAGVLDWRSRYVEYVETRKLYEAREEAERERERAETARRTARRLRVFSVVVGVLFVLAVGAAWLAYKAQQEALDREVTVLAAGYWHPLTSQSGLDATEFTALLKLVRDRTAVKQRFIEQALSDPQLARRLIAKPAPITEAAIGVSPKVRSQLLNRIRDSRATNPSGDTRTAEALILLAVDDPNPSSALVGTINGTNTNSDQLLVAGLVAVAGRLSDTQANALADNLLAAIKGDMFSRDRLSALGSGLAVVAGRLSDTQANALADNLLAAIKGDKGDMFSRDRLSALGSGLAVVAGRLSDIQAKALADTLFVAINGATDRDQLSALVTGLAPVAGRLSDTQGNALADTLLAAIKGTTDNSQLSALGSGLGLAVAAGRLSDTQAKALAYTLFAAINGGTDGHRLSALVTGLPPVAGRLSDTQANALGDTLLSAIKGATFNSGESSAPTAERRRLVDLHRDRTLVLGKGLAALAGGLSDNQANALADNLLVAIKRTTDYSQLSALREGLLAVAGRLSDNQANALANTLLVAIKGATDNSQLSALGSALAVTATRLSDIQAKGLADTLFVAINGATDRNQLSALITGLAPVAGRLSDTQGNTLADTLLVAIKGTTDNSQLSALGSGLAVVAGRLSDTQANALADNLLAAIKGTTDNSQLSALGSGLAVVAGRLSDTQANALADNLLAAIKGTTDNSQLSALGSGLAALAGRLSDSQAKAIGDTLLATIKGTTDTDQLSARGRELGAVAAKVSDAQAKALARALFSSIKVTANRDQLPALGRGLAAATGRARVDARLAKQLIESMKYPGLPRKELAAAVRKDFKDAPPEKDGFWAFILWAQRKFPDLDLDSPAPS